jgi:hypothetical protein
MDHLFLVPCEILNRETICYILRTKISPLGRYNILYHFYNIICANNYIIANSFLETLCNPYYGLN